MRLRFCKILININYKMNLWFNIFLKLGDANVGVVVGSSIRLLNRVFDLIIW